MSDIIHRYLHIWEVACDEDNDLEADEWRVVQRVDDLQRVCVAGPTVVDVDGSGVLIGAAEVCYRKDCLRTGNSLFGN